MKIETSNKWLMSLILRNPHKSIIKTRLQQIKKDIARKRGKWLVDIKAQPI